MIGQRFFEFKAWFRRRFRPHLWVGVVALSGFCLYLALSIPVIPLKPICWHDDTYPGDWPSGDARKRLGGEVRPEFVAVRVTALRTHGLSYGYWGGKYRVGVLRWFDKSGLMTASETAVVDYLDRLPDGWEEKMAAWSSIPTSWFAQHSEWVDTYSECRAMREMMLTSGRFSPENPGIPYDQPN